jgi:hypothetical protein
VIQTNHAAHHGGLPEGTAPEHGPRDGRLIPWADLLTDALGWSVVTESRHLAATVAALSGRKARPHEEGQWQARIPETAITVLATGVGPGALWCRLASRPDSGILAVTIAPWTTATVLKCPVTALPACGTLSVRDLRITTRMGRTVRYLVPEFTPAQRN